MTEFIPPRGIMTRTYQLLPEALGLRLGTTEVCRWDYARRGYSVGGSAT